MDGIILLKKKDIIFKPTEKTKKRRKERIECPCGGRYTNANKAVHIKSHIHNKYLKQIKKDKK